MKNIVVPTDYSDSALHAMHYAASLAQAARARLVLYHAFPYPVITDVPAEINQEMVDAITREEFRRLLDVKKDLVRQYDIEVTCIAQAGSVPIDLEEIMEREKGDLAVMGLRGANPAMHILMGGNTASVLRRGRVPLLIIPPSALYQTPQRILFACNDPLVEPPEMLRPLKDLAALFSAEIEVLMIEKPHLSYQAPSMPRQSNLEEHFGNLRHTYTFEMAESVRQSILSTIRESNAGILAMIPHRHAIWPYLFDKSDTLSIALQTSIPILTLAERGSV